MRNYRSVNYGLRPVSGVESVYTSVERHGATDGHGLFLAPTMVLLDVNCQVTKKYAICSISISGDVLLAFSAISVLMSAYYTCVRELFMAGLTNPACSVDASGTRALWPVAQH